MIALDARRKVIAAALGATAVAGVALLYRFDPNSAASPLPGCIFHALTGLYCPGCGMTRMLHALVHGDIAGAASMNVLALLGLPVLALFAFEQFAQRRVLEGAVRRIAFDGRLWIIAALLFGVLRNLPWAPFSALAPG
ncbi:DUF2752 domain-containing protein [Lysobacter sp. TY2-98]|uniref:DUF2752 domain-containing protein n=1 Tax=Lysobacter sp. TY2-98 TaxID=2290922 RepID=UPI000E1FD2E9|nr:DUF2752 domain-containing protein [Lysobacter sp. TY2-98]AXK72691.1 DUF2752 domain-containing protein [Lysobacter sp. TY2-98]